MRVLIAPIFIASLVIGGTPVSARSNPSAEQIIDSLRRTGNLVSSGTRGIRLAPPPDSETTVSQATPQQRVAATKPVAASQPAPASAPAPAVKLTVDFRHGSAMLIPEVMQTLDELGRALSSKDLAAYRFRSEGHTDTVGSVDYNRALSARRADAVVGYIAKKFGVTPSRLQPVGMGEDALLVPTPPQTPEPRDRRMEVINLGV